jgi:hypothetical protein
LSIFLSKEFIIKFKKAKSLLEDHRRQGLV